MLLLVSDVIRTTEVVIYRERKELLTCGFFCSSLFLKLKNISVIHFRGTLPLIIFQELRLNTRINWINLINHQPSGHHAAVLPPPQAFERVSLTEYAHVEETLRFGRAVV